MAESVREAAFRALVESSPGASLTVTSTCSGGVWVHVLVWLGKTCEVIVGEDLDDAFAEVCKRAGVTL